jgi:hypothetical protein
MQETETLAVQTQNIPGAEPLVHLVARNPVEMQEARGNLALWLTNKIAAVEKDVADYQASLDQAVKNKWNKTGLRKALNQALGQQTFYEKVLAAVEAGYTIVPEFPVEVFAVRVERDYAVPEHVESRYKSSLALTPESADVLPEGAGEYVSNVPDARDWAETKQEEKGGTYTLHHREAVGLRDVVFPIRAARVEVMSATAEAMALKVFDEIGICPPRRQPDPLIIGRILMPRKGGTQKSVSFLIAWHLNLNEL